MTMFDLEKAIAAWRGAYEHRRLFTPDDLKELECHLRDEIDALRADGCSEARAFHEAVRALGDKGTTEQEYRKVFWEKARRHRRFWRELTWTGAMLTNYLKITGRTLRRHWGYSVLNVTGLAVGMACCLLILLFVRDELSYDRFHEHAERIYRIVGDTKLPNGPLQHFTGIGRPVADVLRAEFPEAERLVRLRNRNVPRIKHDGRYYTENAFFAEPTFFDVFSFALVQGDPATALEKPYTLVLTARTARKYFGTQDALSKTLVLDDSLTFTVTGIAADPPAHSHLPFDMLLSWATYEQTNPPDRWSWANFWTYTYVLLRADASPAAFAQKITNLVTERIGPQMAQVGMEIDLAMEPLGDIYLRSKRIGQPGPTGDIRTIYVFSVVALFVLLIACINFMNLTTARSMERAKEVGVRKVVGSSRSGLIRQFLSESLVVVVLAFGVALGLAALALPVFNVVSGKTISLATLLRPDVALGLIGLALVVGLLAGSYPAFALSRFRPVDVLKGTFRTTRRGRWLRKGLVVFQFALSVILIVNTLGAYQQLRFMQTQDLGFDKEQVIVVDARGPSQEEMATKTATIQEAFSHAPSVRKVTASSRVPGRGQGGGIMFPEGLPEGESRSMSYFAVDHDFIETMGIQMVAGRDFSETMQTDVEHAALINETAVESIGWGSPEAALGKVIVGGWDGRRLTVVGVFKDYHHLSLREPIEPLVLFIDSSWSNYFSTRITGDAVPETIAYLEKTWLRFFPEHPFAYSFLDEAYDQQYRADERAMNLFSLFAGLAVLIACLGLFGLAAYTALQRTKEIGVRKVLGASVPNLAALLSREYLVLVLVAFVAAVPAAYYTVNRWLADFAYRIEISWGIFLIAGLLSLAIALLTVSYQSIKAALANPVDSLRYE